MDGETRIEVGISSFLGGRALKQNVESVQFRGEDMLGLKIS